MSTPTPPPRDPPPPYVPSVPPAPPLSNDEWRWRSASLMVIGVLMLAAGLWYAARIAQAHTQSIEVAAVVESVESYTTRTSRSSGIRYKVTLRYEGESGEPHRSTIDSNRSYREAPTVTLRYAQQDPSQVYVGYNFMLHGFVGSLVALVGAALLAVGLYTLLRYL